MNRTDGQLYIDYLSGTDTDALGILFEKYKDGLILFLYGIVGNMEDAEELMMDTFAVLVSGTARYTEKKEASFKTWLFAVAKNQARHFLRKKSRYPVSDVEIERDIKDGDEQPESQLIQDESKVELYNALEEINPEYRQVLYLMYFEDLKPEQISRIIKKTVKQTYNLAARGKTALRKVLERMGSSWNTWDT
ncbi:MAG: sigma-70 family RNA polymerase sigma factor [Clostridiales bacterium]|nr:sigma-70 family RNA polymerase sigma factor [Clostridiales bacterium]MBR5057060.1 sigma-70 family RNA polymerase sigma factor [Clostridiales bacterium]